MKPTTYTTLALCAAFLLTAGNASGTSLGDNITIWDGAGVDYEDGEAEPGMQQTQIWDLEGFFQNGNELSMVGGYNFVTGVSGYDSGDIFISTDSNYGNDGSYTSTTLGNEIVSDNFGYEYVIDLDFNSMIYNILLLDSDDQTITAYYPANENNTPGSNPWRYSSGGDFITTGSFQFITGLTDTETGFLGETHYALTGFDLSFLGVDQEFYSHFTMGCGNDNLMGHGTTAPVPEPATMLLFGTGLAGLTGYARKRKK